MNEASRGSGPEADPSFTGPTSPRATVPVPATADSAAGVLAAARSPIAVATDVGAWRVIWPILQELQRRRLPCRVMLAEPAASIATQDGVAHTRLAAASPGERADAVLAAGPSSLLLGTSVQAVTERELIVRARQQVPKVPSLAVLDAMLFVERRFGVDLAELPDLVACPDEATAHRLRQAGAPASALVVTGNPTLEQIAALPPVPRSSVQPGRPRDILFVSSPVASMRLRGAYFTIDEREALLDLLAALAAVRAHAPDGFRVRVRLHPVQQPDELPEAPPGITLVTDDDPDRLQSCAQADIVVGLSSTLLGEARFLPRTAIAYLPGPFWQQEGVFGPEYGVQLVTGTADLQQLLVQALHEPPAPPPLANHLGAAGRIADLLAGLGHCGA